MNFEDDYRGDARLIVRLVKELIRHSYDEMSEWEQDFCQNIEETFSDSDSGNPSTKQMELVEKLNRKYVIGE